MNTVTYLRRKKRFPVPVPPIVRKQTEPPPQPLSEQTKSMLVVLAVTRAKLWRNE